MTFSQSGALRRGLRLPPPPEPPAGTAGSAKVFKAGKGFYWRRLIDWAFRQIGAIWGIVLGLSFTSFLPERLDLLFGRWITYLEVAAISFFLVQAAISFLLIGLDYRLRWYIVTDRSLRIREGVWRVREQTVSFANVQNLSVRQGPLQRFLEISDLRIRTAGGGDGDNDGENKGDHLHEAVFRGVDNAEEIRDLILGYLRRIRGAGLGDHEDSPIEPDMHSGTDLEAARELTGAARLLREHLASDTQ